MIISKSALLVQNPEFGLVFGAAASYIWSVRARRLQATAGTYVERVSCPSSTHVRQRIRQKLKQIPLVHAQRRRHRCPGAGGGGSVAPLPARTATAGSAERRVESLCAARRRAAARLRPGSAIGDDAAPGIGDKPLAQIRPEGKTTHAERFEAQPRVNTDGENVIWIDYDATLSMHRVRPTVAAERRLERLATPTEEDNRISFGCVNLPVHFCEQVLSPAVKKSGAIVYVLPETRSPQEVFGSWDVTPAAAPVASVGRTRESPPTPAPAARRNRDQ